MSLLLNRHWLITSSTYGTWLPGDQRGFVSRVRTDNAQHEIYNIPTTPYTSDSPALHQWQKQQLSGQPVLLTQPQAELVLTQFQETASYRGWILLVAAVMANHFHVVLSVPGDPEPNRLMKDLKAYASRRLNQEHGKPTGNRWWTRNGSTRKLPHETSVRGAVRYTWLQYGCLARHVHTEVSRDWMG